MEIVQAKNDLASELGALKTSLADFWLPAAFPGLAMPLKTIHRRAKREGRRAMKLYCAALEQKNEEVAKAAMAIAKRLAIFVGADDIERVFRQVAVAKGTL